MSIMLKQLLVCYCFVFLFSPHFIRCPSKTTLRTFKSDRSILRGIIMQLSRNDLNLLNVAKIE